jgi:hypothetical protein
MAAGFTLTDNTQTPQSVGGTTATFSSVTFNTGGSDVAIVAAAETKRQACDAVENMLDFAGVTANRKRI